MTIVDADKIDIVATRADSSTVKLVIADHLPWDDMAAHCSLLRAKIDGYLTFVESGQLFRIEKPPVPSCPNVCITLAALYAPPVEVESFLAEVRHRLAERGISFEVKVEPVSERPP